MKYKIKVLTIAILFFLVIMIIKVNAVGVSSEFYDGNPLSIYPGDNKEIQLELQNMVGNEDVYLKGAITEGSEFVTLTDKNNIYLVPFGTKDVKVNVKVSVPEDIQPGMYKFIVSFVTVTPGETSSTVKIGVGIDKLIPIRVNAPVQELTGKAPKYLQGTGATIILVIILALILIFFLIKNRKKRKSLK